MGAHGQGEFTGTQKHVVNILGVPARVSKAPEKYKYKLFILKRVMLCLDCKPF